MLKRGVVLTMALTLGALMVGCQPAEEGGGGGMEQRQPGGTGGGGGGGTMASPSPGTHRGGGGGGMATPSPGMGGNEQGTPPGPDQSGGSP